jgi:predicted ABC-type ATPase
MRKTVYIIAEPNGAGKPTFALQYLKEMTDRENFINTDMIAYGLNPMNPDAMQFQAGKLFLTELKNYIAKGDSFAFETTLSGKGYINRLKQMRADFWSIILIYLWIPSVEFSAQRVKSRVKQGGHDIPTPVIQRRYKKMLRNLKNEYINLADKTLIYDNSGAKPVLFFQRTDDIDQIYNSEIYAEIASYGDE